MSLDDRAIAVAMELHNPGGFEDLEAAIKGAVACFKRQLELEGIRYAHQLRLKVREDDIPGYEHLSSELRKSITEYIEIHGIKKLVEYIRKQQLNSTATMETALYLLLQDGSWPPAPQTHKYNIPLGSHVDLTDNATITDISVVGMIIGGCMVDCASSYTVTKIPNGNPLVKTYSVNGAEGEVIYGITHDTTLKRLAAYGVNDQAHGHLTVSVTTSPAQDPVSGLGKALPLAAREL